jgi:hypothetical protein
MYSMTALLKNSTLLKPNLKKEAALPAFAQDEQQVFPPAFPHAAKKSRSRITSETIFSGST